MTTDQATAAGAAGISIRLVAPNRIAVGRRQVALGLLWQPAKPDLALRDQAKLAGGIGGGLDLHAQTPAARQIGFATSRDQFSPGMLAGATAINCAEWGGNWLAALKLPGGGDFWWIVAMRDSQIYEDQLHKGETAARHAFEVSLEAPDWERTMAPEAWGVPKAEDVELSDILSLKDAVRLRRVNWEARALAATIGAVLLAATLTYGWLQWSEQRRSEMAQARLHLAAPAPVTVFPWELSPWIPDFISGCLGRMGELLILPPGWMVDSLVCAWSGRSATARAIWRNEGGSPAYLRAAAAEFGEPRLSFAQTGRSAELAVPVPLPASLRPPEGKHSGLPQLESVIRERFRSLGLEASISRRPGTSGGGADAGPGRLDLGIGASAGIEELGKLLSDLPRLVPEALTYRPDANVWHLTAMAHPRPPEVQPDS